MIVDLCLFSLVLDRVSSSLELTNFLLVLDDLARLLLDVVLMTNSSLFLSVTLSFESLDLDFGASLCSIGGNSVSECLLLVIMSTTLM